MFMPDNTVFVPVENVNMTPERTKNARLPMDQRLTTFDEVDLTYTEEEALLEASRCMGCPSRWCSKECPAGMPVPEFIKKIRQKDYEGAYELIASASPLPEFCSRLCPQEKQCQSNCTRAIRTEAVGIGRLERFVVEKHYENAKFAKKETCGKTVAVIGSGPSGLAAAQRLCDKGYAVTVFEEKPLAGGLLRYGIPSMKLDKTTLDRKLTAMEAQGVTFKTGVRADKTAVEGYDAVVISAGAGNARALNFAGAEHAKDIHYAVDFLTGGTSAEGKHVIIVGGGDTGNDCVGVALRHGAASITQIEMLPKITAIQRIFDPLPQKAKEVKLDASQEECLTVYTKDPHIYQATVKAVETDAEGNLVSATVVRLEAVRDAAGRLNMVEIPDSEKTLPCGLLVIAAGFTGPKAGTAEAFGVDTTPRSTVAAEGYKTSAENVFACGDCRTGQSLVVKAMVDGRDCAEAVDAYLRGL